MTHLIPPKQAVRTLDTYPNTNHSYEVTIRFSASISDLPLSVPANNGPTTATLKQLVRASLPVDLKDKRIRLIHAGKALDDAVPLSTSLKRLVSRPPSRVATPGPYDSGADSETGDKSKVKGKQAVRETTLARVYIHCSIGDVTLSPEDLEAEAALAHPTQIEKQDATTQQSQDEFNTNTTTPAPRGFERLLTAGFTASEVAALRLQFMSIQSHTHTPDTMPSPNALRAMEDQWLDNSGSLGLDETAAGATTAGGIEDDSARGALDDMIWGTTFGFFWPVGCLIWGLREEGIFSPRRKIAIAVGVVLNLGLGFVRWGG
ncbi:hypothetical protein LTS08_004288 [Lithohypha guttulata]|nr:hypothetical protein LTS08_004288 [Lithohypha guttulata]